MSDSFWVTLEGPATTDITLVIETDDLVREVAIPVTALEKVIQELVDIKLQHVDYCRLCDKVDLIENLFMHIGYVYVCGECIDKHGITESDRTGGE